jgi:hypothetical protein
MNMRKVDVVKMVYNGTNLRLRASKQIADSIQKKYNIPVGERWHPMRAGEALALALMIENMIFRAIGCYGWPDMADMIGWQGNEIVKWAYLTYVTRDSEQWGGECRPLLHLPTGHVLYNPYITADIARAVVEMLESCEFEV